MEKIIDIKNNKYSELLTKKGTIQQKYKDVFYTLTLYIKNNDKKMHLKYWSKSKGHFNLHETEYLHMLALLDILEIKYREGNDAPQGGIAGDYIEILSDKRNSIIKKILEVE